jgi:hypothetical protein
VKHRSRRVFDKILLERFAAAVGNSTEIISAEKGTDSPEGNLKKRKLSASKIIPAPPAF